MDNHLLFKGLADPHRIKIVELLAKGEECNCNLGEKIAMPLSTLAHHMKVLSTAGLINTRREGKWTYYILDKEQLEKATRIINDLLQ